MSPAVDLPSSAFRREREASWKELDRLLGKIDAGGIRALTARELADLPHLYRTTLSSLSLARSISLDKNLVDYLEALATRGYFAVYGPTRRLAAVVIEFFARSFPAAVRRYRWQLMLSSAFLLAGVAIGWASVARDPELYFTLVPAGLAQGRDPGTATDVLRNGLYDGEASGAFATWLFTHNAGVGILSFAIGFAAGIPVFLLMLSNGVILGAFGALFASRGLAWEFFAWVLPHGVTELLAVVLCGAGGLVLAQNLVLPGRRRRVDNLAEGGREAGQLATGAVAMLVIAAIFEGIFRQAVHDPPTRLGVAGAFAAWWLWYFARAGRDKARAA